MAQRDLEIRDGVLWNSQELCHAEMGNDQGIETSISDAATSAIIPIDTAPGMTAHIRVTDDLEGELSFARREIVTDDVTEESPDRFVGTITDESAQLLIEADW